MKQLLCTIMCLLTLLTLTAQQSPKSYVTNSGSQVGFYEFKPYDYNANPTKKYPLIIFLHGSGERGNGTNELSRVLANGIPRLLNAGATMKFTVNGVSESFMVLSPQLTSALNDWNNFYVDAMLEYAVKTLRVDVDRIYLTGLSLGGGGAWTYVTLTPGNATKIAALVPICGNSYQTGGIPYMSNEHLPVWAFHALDDNVVGAWNTQFVVSTMNATTPAPSPAPLMTLYPTGGHSIWDRAYDTGHGIQNPNIYEWFLMHSRAGTPSNITPIGNAGSNVSMVYPVNSTTLNASASVDPDGTIAMYSWAKKSGPDNFVITSPNSSVSNLTGLVTGTYIFQVKVTDYMGAVDSSLVSVTVNPSAAPNIPPVADAGTNVSTAAASVNLSGYGSYDPDGYIVAYDWKQIDGPAPAIIGNVTTPSPTMSNLVGGSYHFAVSVFDNLGATQTASVTVINTNFNAALPVTFTSVQAFHTEAGNLVKWATSAEMNSSYFDVQKSTDGKSFSSIGHVNASGASATVKAYQFADSKIGSGAIYYRLVAIDKDAKKTFSKVVVLNTVSKAVSVSVFPNPVSETVNISMGAQVKGSGSIQLRSIDGAQVRTVNFNKDVADYTESVNIRDLTSGIYLVEINSDNGFRFTQRIVKN